MYTDDAEAGYLQRRIAASTAMARAATDECARKAHQTLAALYAGKLKALLRAMNPPAHHQKPAAMRGAPAPEHSKMHGTLGLHVQP